MSLPLAKDWMRAMIGEPAALAETLQLLDQAAADGVNATLIVGPHLTTSGKSFFARWDGREFVSRELTCAQLQDWGLDPQGLFRQLQPLALPQASSSTEPLISLTFGSIPDADGHDGWAPLTGTCVTESQAAPVRPIPNCALRAEYFRPDLQRQITHMWYAHRDLPSERTTLQFEFPPLFSQANPHPCQGTLVVFFQLFTADSWTRPSHCRRISNVAHTVITLRYPAPSASRFARPSSR